jgi:hypothetical protein
MLLAEHDLFCDPEGIQTPNLLIRSQMLYSVKLRDPFATANIIKNANDEVPKVLKVP